MPVAYSAKHQLENPGAQTVRAKNTLRKLPSDQFNGISDHVDVLAVKLGISPEMAIYLLGRVAECLAVEKHMKKIAQLLPVQIVENVKNSLTPEQIFCLAEACDTRQTMLEYLSEKFGVEV
jgi:hypothetical protein